jgi:hypothetical protein
LNIHLLGFQETLHVHISKTIKIILDFWPFWALCLLWARQKEVTSITSLTNSQFTVEFIKVSNSTLKFVAAVVNVGIYKICTKHSVHCLHIPAALPMPQLNLESEGKSPRHLNDEYDALPISRGIGTLEPLPFLTPCLQHLFIDVEQEYTPSWIEESWQLQALHL